MSILNGTTAPTVKVQYDYTWPLGVREPSSSNWRDLPTYTVKSISIRRGKTQENQLVQPGECTIVFDNRSGAYDPMNTSSPYMKPTLYGPTSYFSRNLGIRVVATWNSVNYVLYQGYMEQLDLDYGIYPTVTMTFVDLMAYLANQQLAAIPMDDGGTPPVAIPAVGNGDQIWFRVESMLAANDPVTGREGCNLPTGLSALDTSVDNTLYGTRYGSDVLDLIQTAANCEPARVFVDRDGIFRLLRWDGGDDNALVLSDSQVAGTVGYNNIEVDPGSKYLLNWVSIRKVNGDGVVTGVVAATVPGSESRFGPVQATYELPTNTAAPLATFLANQYAEPIDRVRRITFSNTNLGTAFPKVLVTDLADVVTVQRTTYDGRHMTFTCHVEGIEHNITPDAWEVGFICSTDTVVTDYAWVNTMTTTGTQWTLNGALDSGDNTYFTSTYGTTSTPTKALVGKVDSNATLLWQRLLGTASDLYSWDAVANSAGVYTVSSIQTAVVQDYVVSAVSSTGTFSWGRTISGCLGYNSCAVDSTGSLYMAGQISVAGFPYSGYLTKFSSGGSLLWQVALTPASYDVAFTQVAVDATNNVFVAGTADIDLVAAKYDSSGSLQWQRTLTGPAYPPVSATAVDAAGNFLIGGSAGGQSFLIKLSPLGGVMWQKTFGSFSGIRSIACDASNNIYVADSSSKYVMLNSSGVVQYARNIIGLDIYGVSLDAAGALRFSGLATGPTVMSLPANGSKTGSVTVGGKTFTISSASVSVSSGSFTSATSTFTAGSPAIIPGTSGYSTATSTFADASIYF